MGDERVELEKITPAEPTPFVRPGYPSLAGYPDAGGYGYGYGSDDDKMHLREIWRIVRKHKWLILLIVSVVTTLVAIDSYRDKNIYQASAIVEIGRENTNVRLGDFYFSPDLFNSTEVLRTSILVMRSRPLVEDVVDTLNLDRNPNFKEGRRRAFSDALSLLLGNEELKEKEKEIVPTIAPPVLQPSGTATRSAEDTERLAPYVGGVLGGLSVEPVRDTRALKISFTHVNPHLTAEVANGVAETFRHRVFRTQIQKYVDTTEFLKKMLAEAETNATKAEQDLATFTGEKGIFPNAENASLATEKLTALHNQYLEAQKARIERQALYDTVKSGDLNKLPDSYVDPKIGEMRKKLEELEVRIIKLKEIYGAQHPIWEQINQERLTLTKQLNTSISALQQKLQAEYNQVADRERGFAMALKQAEGEAIRQNQDIAVYNIYKDNAASQRKLYQEMLSKYEAAKIQVAEQYNSIRIIEPAQVPGGPIGPMRFRSIMIAFFLSLACSVGVAFLLNYLDNTIKTVEDVSRYAQLPALSVIPALIGSSARQIKGKKSSRKSLPAANLEAHRHSPAELMALDNRSSAAEAYRVLRTSVLLSSAGSPPKRMLVTSGQPSEGKTTTAVNMGISLAQLGSSVLVIDCDLRKPSVHKLFALDHSRGLSTYLSRNVDLDSLIQHVSIPNLSVLPCGPIPPNPAELISSDKMKHMLAELSEKYDHILIDSPPLINVTDPMILSTMVDGVILVVHGGKSTRDVVRRVRQELTAVGAKIFGVVLNNVDLRKEGYDYYYYHRYYSDYYGSEKSESTGD